MPDRLRRAVEKFDRDLGRHGMTLKDVKRREDGTPEMVIRVGEEEQVGKTAVTEQLEFEGMPVAHVRFSLRSATDLWGGEGVHEIGDPVGGQWKGRVAGVLHEEKKGELVRKHIVEVEEGTIG